MQHSTFSQLSKYFGLIDTSMDGGTQQTNDMRYLFIQEFIFVVRGYRMSGRLFEYEYLWSSSTWCATHTDFECFPLFRLQNFFQLKMIAKPNAIATQWMEAINCVTEFTASIVTKLLCARALPLSKIQFIQNKRTFKWDSNSVCSAFRPFPVHS